MNPVVSKPSFAFAAFFREPVPGFFFRAARRRLPRRNKRGYFSLFILFFRIRIGYPVYVPESGAHENRPGRTAGPVFVLTAVFSFGIRMGVPRRGRTRHAGKKTQYKDGRDPAEEE